MLSRRSSGSRYKQREPEEEYMCQAGDLHDVGNQAAGKWQQQTRDTRMLDLHDVDGWFEGTHTH